MSSLSNKQITSVYITASDSENLNMAFCMFTRTPLMQFHGRISSVIPGGPPSKTQTYFKVPKSDMFYYTFTTIEKKEIGPIGFFGAANGSSSRVNYCMQCAAPLIYTMGGEAYQYHDQDLVKKRQVVKCQNPNCQSPGWEFLGIVEGYFRDTFDEALL